MVTAARSEQRSGIREFVTFLATVRGDLSSVTAPPFILATQSLVEHPSYWAERPSLFVAPSLEPDPALRALLVFKLWLSALKRQTYVGVSQGKDPKEVGGIKKPLNPFLGECFLGSWDDGDAKTKVISEQVSHHPPTTACYITSTTHDIYAQAHSTQSTTLTLASGIPTIIIRQSGHAILTIPAYNETHILPLPDVRVKGFLTGTPYPELSGTYYMQSSSGYTTEIRFSGKGWMSGSKHSFDAVLFKTPSSFSPSSSSPSSPTPIYTASGQWTSTLTFTDARTNNIISTFDPLKPSNQPSPLTLPPIGDQSPWESRRAWAAVRAALETSDFGAVVMEKAKIEDAQRAMRRGERERGEKWEARFFVREEGGMGVNAERLVGMMGLAEREREKLVGRTGVWRFDFEREKEAGGSGERVRRGSPLG